MNLKALLAKRMFPNRRILAFFDITDGLTFATVEMQADFLKWLDVYAEAAGVPNKLPPKLVEALKLVRTYAAQHRDDRLENGDA